MQTFLPFRDFRASAETLDYRRLGKQRVEAFQLLIAIDDTWAIDERVRKGLTGPVKGWRNHPAAVMWRGYGDALRCYMNTMIQEWIKRGYNNNMAYAPVTYVPGDSFDGSAANEEALRFEHNNWHELQKYITVPSWLGYEPFHASHRANLLRKDAVFYGKYGWIEDPAMPYMWPLRIGVIGSTTDSESVSLGSIPRSETINSLLV